ncbi:MAG TPA: phosphotransferase [Ktedonobacterales bacterium]|nr:phosphotransferase [Ktedonobacterales bacterium]
MADHCSIAPHPTEPRVLVVAEGDSWTLPRHETEDAEAIRDLMRQRFGLAVTVLGAYAGYYTDIEHDEPAFIFALETHGADGALPDGSRWIGRADLAGIALAVDEQRVALARWLAEAESGIIPAERAPWEQKGWFTVATEWIEQQLDRLGWQRTGPYVQLHARGWSSVLRLPTTGGNVFFKAVTQPFAFESPLTALLAELRPAESPRVLAVDRDRRWLLMADAGEPIRDQIRETRNPQAYQDMLVAFAQFQLALLPYTPRLESSAIPDRRLEVLPALFAGVMSDSDGLLVSRPGGLSTDEYVQLQATDVADLAARLASYGIPETLVQEDCHPGHWIAGENGPIFFDWGDTCLGHPFQSLMMALRWARLVLGFDAATLDSLRDAYLSQWSAYGSLERLREAYHLAWRLTPLTRALTWYRIVANQEPAARWQYEDAAPYWLSLFLHGEDKDG